jgi:hypothetical protein
MSTVNSSSEVVQVIQATLAAPVEMPVLRPARAVRPLEITIRVSPKAAALLAGPVAVMLVLLVAGALVRALDVPLHGAEMVAGGLMNAVGGVMAALPLVMVMHHGTTALVQAGVLGIPIRCGVILMMLCLALVPATGLDRAAVVTWTVVCYFPLLVVETAMAAWLMRKA